MKAIKVTGNNEGLYTLEAYQELRLQMSTGDFHTHKKETVKVANNKLDEVIELTDLVAPLEEPVTVIFRTFKKGGDVIAFFPYEDAGNGFCSSYQHIGQHGDADYRGLLADTRPATKDEAAELAAELRRVGYLNLKVAKRRSFK